jgi:hypothetical protein
MVKSNAVVKYNVLGDQSRKPWRGTSLLMRGVLEVSTLSALVRNGQLPASGNARVGGPDKAAGPNVIWSAGVPLIPARLP